MALPAPWVLLALLLLTAYLLAEESDQDSPSCTSDSVTRDQLAMMSCTVSTPLSQVAIFLSAPGKASKLIFSVDGPGNFSNSGWQLEVRGGEARLVIPKAQPAQAGEYMWHLVGIHGSVGHTRLNVSESLVTVAASTPPAAPGTWPPPPASTVSPVLILLAVIAPILVLAVIAVLTWRRRCHSRYLRRIQQMFTAQSPGPERGENKAM